MQQYTVLEPPLDRPLSFKGRFSRLSYLAWLLLGGLVLTACLFGVLMLSGAGVLIMQGATAGNAATLGSSLMGGVGLIGMLIFTALALYITLLFGIRRLHDMDKRGWLILLLFIPLVGQLFWLYMTLMPGTAGPNRFGPVRPTLGWEKVLGWIYVVLGILSVIAYGFMGMALLAAQAAQ